MSDQDQMRQRQKVLADFGAFALSCDDLDQILTEACRLVAAALGTGRAKVLEIQGNGQQLFVRAGVGWASGIVGRLHLPMGERSSETYSIRQGEPVITRDTDREDRFEVPGFMREAGVVAFVNVPIRLPGGTAYGLLQVDAVQPRDFAEDDTEFLRTYATILGPVIDRLLRLRDLRDVEERFRLTAEEARDYAIFVTDREGRIVDWLPGAAAVFGWTAAEAVGLPMSTLFTADDREDDAPEKERAQARAEGVAPDIRWHLRKDGSRVFIEGSVRALRDGGGRLTGFLKIGQDVTQRRAAEAALRESEARFRAFVNASSDVVYRMSSDWSEMRQLDGQGFLANTADPNESWMEHYIHPDDRPAVQAAISRSVRDGTTFELEHRVIQADGSLAWTLSRAVPIHDGEGQVSEWLGTASNVTARRRAELALSESEARFRGFAEASADVLWIADARAERLDYLSPAFERVYGVPRVEAMAGQSFVAQLVHPEDRDAFLSLGPRAIAGEAAVAHYRVVHPDGSVVPVRDTAFVIRDGAGDVVQVAGIVQDISDMEAAREAVEAEKERFRTLAEGIPPLVWRSADEGNWTWSSPQWRRHTGQTQAESHGLGWLQAIHPDDREAMMAAWHAARSRGRLEVECRVLRACDGSWRWHQARSVPVRDGATPEEPEGQILEWLGTTTDIDDLKRLQAEQGILLAELQHRTRNLLSVVRSVARKSVPASPGRDEYDARLAALGRVQGFLAQTGSYTVSLRDLVEAELQAAGAGESSRVTVEGPSIELPGAGVQPMALALHELATNAVKYGALIEASSDGRLAILWRIEERRDGVRLLLSWRESGVAMPPGPPARRGYGSELITRALPYQLKAETRLEFTPDGVSCEVVLSPGTFRIMQDEVMA